MTITTGAYHQQAFIVIMKFLWTVLFALLLQEPPEKRLFVANAAAFSSISTALFSSRVNTDGSTTRRGRVINPSSSSSSSVNSPFSAYCLRTIRRSSSNNLFLSRDWIDKVNYMDDDENGSNKIDAGGTSVAPDMKYIPRNVLRQNENFVAIRQVGGTELTNDVYIRQSTTTTDKKNNNNDEMDDDEMEECTFWYVGKIARISDVTPQQAIQRQWNLIETHASQLRPLELYPARGSLEIFLAPGDSELQVAYHRPDVKMTQVDRIVNEQDNKALQTQLKSNLMGFQGEIYNGGEEGFRTLRYSDGRPSRKEISAAAASQEEEEDNDDEQLQQTPTDAEMAEIQQQLQGQDLNALYEEQQRRAGKPIID
jgi:hypothetical protein